MRKQCKICETTFAGRSDKQFCSLVCKNLHNTQVRMQTNSIVKDVDGYLHRNRQILATLMPSGTKAFFDTIVLDRAGFRWEYFTGTYENKEGKWYHYVYDYAWMRFSNRQVLVVRKGA
jgi:hypothetical protein